MSARIQTTKDSVDILPGRPGIGRHKPGRPNPDPEHQFRRKMRHPRDAAHARMLHRGHRRDCAFPTSPGKPDGALTDSVTLHTHR